MNTHDAADPLYKALLAQARQSACDDIDDQEVLDAIDRARTAHDKLAYSSCVPDHLCSAITDALPALDPTTYSPTPTAPGTPMPDLELHRVRDATITVVDASPEDNTPSDIYEIQVFDISVLIRRRAQWGAPPRSPTFTSKTRAKSPVSCSSRSTTAANTNTPPLTRRSSSMTADRAYATDDQLIAPCAAYTVRVHTNTGWTPPADRPARLGTSGQSASRS
ncbi:hypothetical protein ABT072_46325 [Streptomyces sp. NPDC002589]|uniref:hypothetical protein n=1 Tax=Streptomyces sp. NPDC002589 TaxID=3154420 RepID=UPI00331C4AA8